MAQVRVVFLWHMHQPFYKDLVSGEYRLPWVRMHALKDYYGMVRLLQEFPQVRQTFNLVPSLMIQIQDYVAGSARDPFFDIAAKPARDLSAEERRFALQYLFQANREHMVRRYARYEELWQKAEEAGDEAGKRFSAQDFTDLQVLSQIAWFDEFFLEEPEIAGLARKARNFTLEDQGFVCSVQSRLLGRVLPEYSKAAQRGSIEISASPFYHPILPLLCDSNAGRVSSPGLALPHERFRHPEDAREQLQRALELHASVFGMRPRGVWPSEGSLSEEVLHIGHELGVEWMATDEGVLGRSTNSYFHRDGDGRLDAEAARRLYRVYRYERAGRRMNLLFRDHAISDLIGFVYSGMEAKAAAAHFVESIRNSTQALLEKGEDATVAVILDGENAWEHYPRSGREFLRRLYEAMTAAEFQMVTASEAVAQESAPGALTSLVPGSWINANFNVWIGAPEDNRSWDHLHAARDFFAEQAPAAPPEQRQLAWEELLIAEGSDWNWWYGPEHHSANDRDFDDLYRKHLANVYRALGAAPPERLAQSIIRPFESQAQFVPQTSFIHPAIDGDSIRYFDWIGAATLIADSRDSTMHGREFLLKTLHAGIDESRLYGRLEFENLDAEKYRLGVQMEAWREEAPGPAARLELEAELEGKRLTAWRLKDMSRADVDGMPEASGQLAPEVRFLKVLEFSLPLELLPAAVGGKLRLRTSLWRNELPLDSLPAEGWMEIAVKTEEEMSEFV
ncbi:MAG: glycoside hydrolase [Acidobacteria bacterium]|nr:MAG: glycoside hydrolase [Acidobacteriota bacterium]